MPQPLDQVIASGQVWQGQSNAAQQPRQAVIDSGFAALNDALPAHGWQSGQVCEIYGHAGPLTGNGEVSLILPALAQLSQQPRWILWVGSPNLDTHNGRMRLQPQAAALQQAGIDVRRVLLVHPKDEQQAMWCLEEGLKSGHCSAVLGWPQRLHKAHIRRLQLACAHHQSYCWLWPQSAFDPSGSPAAVRLGIQRQSASAVEIECYKRRGQWPGHPFTLDLNRSHTERSQHDKNPWHRQLGDNSKTTRLQ
ncbi:MAG: hypothetical protein CMI08_02855 [Oceanospirillaceae bacterium]|uniref:ImuA family protein n=1 Tax=unclassified Thalassolituus TaxID=2624967 RepID=UPI000C0936B2|nr:MULTISPECIES: SulA-like leucine-rich domain-containing protein [unclassified Thalassolituus]MAK90236.1 hypothetical protein [Thalassolituus sp.]MAS26506.1 hypothetical protein [Oceanospirillaceae bacterium]MAX98135.1 hypothetical protein [Oceanospirillaceae bacterium]MBL34264.1 hypothetical protein [Oceanospirillaceae bacterium]MBS52784.1 hypothetical protein [Oceanospirillaceae bacterium]|tara:strand:+ start:3203 stop:3952 length:750 start_codon:yes stop_codon:yes gene_type:complete